MYKLSNCTNCTTCGDCHEPFPETDSPPLFCMHCSPDNAPCILSCKQNAFELLGGAITLNKEKCNKCLECIDVCPIEIIKIE